MLILIEGIVVLLASLAWLVSRRSYRLSLQRLMTLAKPRRGLEFYGQDDPYDIYHGLLIPRRALEEILYKQQEQISSVEKREMETIEEQEVEATRHVVDFVKLSYRAQLFFGVIAVFGVLATIVSVIFQLIAMSKGVSSMSSY